MMIELRPMSPQIYQAYYDSSVTEYAEELVKAGNVSADNAQAATEKTFSQLLSNGLDTTGQHLMSIWDPKSESNVGMVWVGEREQGGKRQAVIYDIRVNEELRGKGFGTQTLRALEKMVHDMGLSEIWLHVYGHNTGARRLYERMGYEVTNVTMRKKI
jgi:ribosomal protein S18 acetylase RimI-like enzyme